MNSSNTAEEFTTGIRNTEEKIVAIAYVKRAYDPMMNFAKP